MPGFVVATMDSPATPYLSTPSMSENELDTPSLPSMSPYVRMGRMIRPDQLTVSSHRFMCTAGHVLVVALVQFADFASDLMVIVHEALP